MTPSEEIRTCSLAQALIEPYLDGELPEQQEADLKQHLAQCRICASEFDLAIQVRRALRELPQMVCPDRVTDEVLERVRAEHGAPAPSKLRHWLGAWFEPVWRPALATALLVLAIVATLLTSHRTQPPDSISPKELARAEAEVKWTLAYMGEIGLRTGLLVRDDVIETQVVLPMKRAMQTMRAADADRLQ